MFISPNKTIIKIICCLFFLMTLLYCSCDSHQPQYGECEVLPDKIGAISTSLLMPYSSSKIKYVYHNTGFGYGIEWESSVSENNFLSFCKRNNFLPLSKKPEDENYFFHFYQSFDMPSSYYYVLEPRASSAALRLLYDRETQLLYGSYSDH